MMRLLPIFTSALLTLPSMAATVVYDFTGETTQANGNSVKTSAATSNDFGSGISVSVLTLTPGDGGTTSITDDHGFPANDFHGYMSFRDVPGPPENPTVSFTITVDAGHVLDLTSLQFLVGVFDDVAGSQTGDASYVLTSSLDGITSNQSNSLTMSEGILVSDTYTAGLGPALTGLTDTSVTFTWAFNTANGYDSASSERGHVIDDIVLTGSVSAVPEPSAAMLGGLGLLALLRHRRR